MSSTSETGHAKNVSNFNVLISSVKGYGDKYNPSNPALAVTALEQVLTSSQAANKKVNEELSVYTKAVADREAAYAPLSKFATRIVNSLKAAGAQDAIVSNAFSIVKKIQGARVKAVKKDPEQTDPQGDEKPVSIRSSSQMSYDNRLANLEKLTELLAATEEYNPNEEELKVVSLNTLYSILSDLNNTVVTTETALSNARSARAAILYSEETGLTSIVKDIKAYVKSVFGSSSSAYKQISGIKFITIKK